MGFEQGHHDNESLRVVNLLRLVCLVRPGPLGPDMGNLGNKIFGQKLTFGSPSCRNLPGVYFPPLDLS